MNINTDRWIKIGETDVCLGPGIDYDPETRTLSYHCTGGFETAAIGGGGGGVSVYPDPNAKVGENGNYFVGAPS